LSQTAQENDAFTSVLLSSFLSPRSNLSDKFDSGKIFVITISIAILRGTLTVSSQFVQQSLAQEMGQNVERNETGNQTSNQSAGLGDP
jgi:hypothetical protein